MYNAWGIYYFYYTYYRILLALLESKITKVLNT